MSEFEDLGDLDSGNLQNPATDESFDTVLNRPASVLLDKARLHAEDALRAVSKPEDRFLKLCKEQIQAAIHSLENASASFWKSPANGGSTSNVQDQDMESSGDLMDVTLGSQGLVKKSEFIRIITEALFSLGYDGIAANLEKESGVGLHNPTTKQFLELVKNGEWDKSIDALKSFELRDEKPVRFVLLEQKVFDIWKNDSYDVALTTVNEEIAPLGIWPDRVRQLTNELETLVSECVKTAKQRSKEVVNKLQRLFPPAVLIPERRLEYLLEQTLDRQRSNWELHNGPASDFSLSLCSDHFDAKVPTETVQILGEHTGEVWFVKFSHNGKYLASSSKDNSAIIWEMNAEGKFVMKHKLVGHEKPVVAVLWSPDDRQVITCGDHEDIRRWNVDSGGLVGSYKSNRKSQGRLVRPVSCGWAGEQIVGAMTDRRLSLWNLDGLEIELNQLQRAEEESNVAMTTDGIVSLGVKSDQIILYRDGTEKVIEAAAIVYWFTLSEDNAYLLIDTGNPGNGERETIELWSLQDEERIAVLVGHQRRESTILTACFGGKNQEFVASGSIDSNVYIWQRPEAGGEDTHETEPYQKLAGHSRSVNCVSWNPKYPRMLASASDDRTIRIWGTGGDDLIFT